MEEECVFRLKEGNCAVVKGKRTTRLRLQPSFVFEVDVNNNNNSNIIVDEDYYCPSGDGDREKTNNDGVKFFPGSSSERIDEEEDVAGCLILLAQGQTRDFMNEVDYRRRPSYVDRRRPFDGEDQKFNSKRYLEATTGAGKFGYYVYECKTCNRTFPSFQALGGHRASHKKPKVVMAETKRHLPTPPLILDSDDEASAARFIRGSNSGFVSSTISLQLTSSRDPYCVSGKDSNNNNNQKVHECAVCGTKFSSGQALGGHMRRHRAQAGTSPGLSLTSLVTPPDSEGPPMRVRTLVSFDLDLNLPAPEAAGDNNLHETSNDTPVTPPQPKK